MTLNEKTTRKMEEKITLFRIISSNLFNKKKYLLVRMMIIKIRSKPYKKDTFLNDLFIINKICENKDKISIDCFSFNFAEYK